MSQGRIKREVRSWFLEQLRQKPSVEGNLTLPLSSSGQSFLVATPENTHSWIGVLSATDEPLKLKLHETNTFWLLSIISGYTDSDNAELELCHRKETSPPKCLVNETQTPGHSEKCKASETVDVKVTSSYVNASAWDLYDTYALVGGENGFGIKEFQLLIDTALKTRGVIQSESDNSIMTRMPAEKQMRKLVQNPKFQYCLLTIERLLASKTFNHQQMVLRQPPKQKYDSVEPTLFSYQITLLWTYDNHFEKPIPVTAFDWNPKSDMILSVGYGELNFCAKERGLVCVWSPKNPSHSERRLPLPYSITAIKFSSQKPHVLAAGCRSGHVLLIDITHVQCSISVLAKVRYGPVWRVLWLKKTVAAAAPMEDQLLVLGEAGVLTCYTLHKRNSSDLMELKYSILLDSGESNVGQPELGGLFSVKTLSGLWLSLVPEKDLCYIGSQEGVVVKFNLKSPCSVEGRLAAHVGPVYVIQQSPATYKIFLTCGADHHLHIWMDGIDKPLITLVSAMTLVSGSWSPTLPTVIASLSTGELCIWDIAHSTSQPVNRLRLRTSDYTFTTLHFYPDGSGLVVGDQLGHVRAYRLSQLPREPFLKVEALTYALKAAVASKPDLAHQLNKLLQFNQELFQTNIT